MTPVSIPSYIEGPTTSSLMTHYIGSEHGNSPQYAIQGFIWFFPIVSDIDYIFFISDSPSSFCFTGVKKFEPCLPSVLIDYIAGYLPTCNSSTTYSYDRQCEDSGKVAIKDLYLIVILKIEEHSVAKLLMKTHAVAKN